MVNQKARKTSSTKNDTLEPKKSSSPKKKFKIAGIIVGVLFLLLLLIGATGSVVPEYSLEDLVPVKKDAIEFSRPEQWEDASFAENLVKDFGLEVSNASIYGDKVVKDKNDQYDVENAAVIFGLASNETTDLAIVKRPEFKAKFEELMNGQLKEENFKSGSCKTVTNFGKNFNYDYNNIPVSVAIKLNCGLTDSQKDKFNADSIELRMAIMIANDGKTYMYALMASDKSWEKNEPVYFQMMKDLKGI